MPQNLSQPMDGIKIKHFKGLFIKKNQRSTSLNSEDFGIINHVSCASWWLDEKIKPKYIFTFIYSFHVETFIYSFRGEPFFYSFRGETFICSFRDETFIYSFRSETFIHAKK